MSTAPKRLLTPQEYLSIERRAATRSEYYRGETFAMTGASWAHTLIKVNLAVETAIRLRGGTCRVVTSDLRVKIEATGLYCYPDVVVVCDDPKFDDEIKDTLLNPRVVIEVLSDSTEKYGRGTKFSHYRQLPSLKEYVLVSQDSPLVERFVRQPDESWLLTAFGDVAQSFSFATIPAAIPLSEIYRGVKFPESLA
jgi:Uma2 family endonuclease